MPQIENFTIQGKEIRLTEYNDIHEIITIIEENEQFHDGIIENISHNLEETIISFRHHQDSEHRLQRLIFTGNVELTMNLDLLVRYIYEINCEIDSKIEINFDGTGIVVKADGVKYVIQEVLN